MRKNSFIQGALILTVAGIIVKFIGAFSRIYLSRLLGGEGIGLYQMAYPIYMLCLSISSAGLPVAISIMVAERNAVNDYWGGTESIPHLYDGTYPYGYRIQRSFIFWRGLARPFRCRN